MPTTKDLTFTEGSLLPARRYWLANVGIGEVNRLFKTIIGTSLACALD